METLTDRAEHHLLDLMRRHNRLTDDHRRLLRATVEILFQCVRGDLGNRRVAVPIPTGGGKSSAVRAVIRALHEHEPEGTDGVLILTEQIQAGEDLMRDLVDEDGIPTNVITHVHSRGGAVAEDAAHFRFVIATHEKSKREDIVRLLTFEGRRRGVIIDEGLHASDAFGFRAEEAANAFDTAIRYGEADGDHDLVEWAKTARDSFGAAIANLGQGGGSAAPVHIPVPDFDSESTLRSLKRRRDSFVAHRLLQAAVVHSTFTLTASGVLQHRRVLPEELNEGVVVLDAGYQIDALQRLDDGLVDAEKLPVWPKGIKASALKNWSDVSLYHMNAPGGATKQVEDSRRRNLYAREAVDFILRHARDGDEVLLCLYQKVERQQKSEIIRGLRHKLGDKLEVSDDRREHTDSIWVRFIHWGQHHSTNRYQGARIGVALGDFPLSDLVARAWARGQQSIAGEATELAYQDVQVILDSWCATRLLQLVGRLRNRQVENGRAKESVVGFITARERTVGLLQKAMPGSIRCLWPTPDEILAVAEGGKRNEVNEERAANAQVNAVARKVSNVLAEVPGATEDEGAHVSVQRLRKLCGFPTTGRKKVTSDTFSKGVSRAIEGTRWTRIRQSVVLEEAQVDIETLFP